MKKAITWVALSLCALAVNAQTKPADTVVIKVGAGSKVIFAIQDKKDLETLKRYDFQALMNDMIAKLENRDTTASTKPAASYLKDSTKAEEVPTENWSTSSSVRDEDEDENEDSYRENWTVTRRTYSSRRTYRSFSFDVGTNNYLSNGKFPDQDNSLYSVRPWGSWYIGLNSIYRTRMANKLFLEWGLGASWYNFKFQNSNVQVTEDNNAVSFIEDTRDLSFRKSKLTATYLNASVVPMIDFGNNRRKGGFLNDSHSRGFRMGAGMYAGYRINSYARQVFKENGDRDSDKNNNNFYLNNFRYGVRAQIGIDDVDFFFNYDLNDLFSANRGPQLNAFSFGVSF